MPKSEKSRSVYTFCVVGGNAAVVKMFEEEGHKVVTSWTVPHDIIVFTGGADVFPLLYGQRVHSKTQFSIARDNLDNAAFHSTPMDKPKIGICRGAQFLCIKAGGSLWQHVNNHTTPHDIEFDSYKNGFTLRKASSTHHQMMIPTYDMDVIGFAGESTVRETETEGQIVPDWEKDPDPEVVYCWRTNALMFQPHPEYLNDATRATFFDLIEDYFDRDINPKPKEETVRPEC